jgi:phosphoribosylaminoimidazole-succinocarboxamide synthase
MPAVIHETDFDLPGQVGDTYHGKVGDVYTIDHDLGNLLAVVRTDRISAFDVILPEAIPYKGQVLNQLSAALLTATREDAPNWLITSPDPNVSIGYRADPIKVEMIMRGALLGTSWRSYQAGMREFCGNRLPERMYEFEVFDTPLLTPTTKADAGHDENITSGEVVRSGLVTAQEFDQMEALAFTLFARGQAMAKERGLFLADTKYEFGRLATGEVIVIDEVHTPDSSRYFKRDEYNRYLHGDAAERPTQLSKEFVREWLLAHGFSGEPGQALPNMTSEFVTQISDRYIGLFELMMGQRFEPSVADNEPAKLERIRANIVGSLGNISLA